MRKIAHILVAVLLVASCNSLTESFSGNPYSDAMCTLSVDAVYPAGFEGYMRMGVNVKAEEVNQGHRYIQTTDAEGKASFKIPQGIYRVSISDVCGDDIFGGAVDKIHITADTHISDTLAHSIAGRLIIKEIYCGGCMKTPEQGTYQADKYLIIHNNYHEVQYLDGVCLGTLAPYNSNSSNPFLKPNPETGVAELPSYLPVIQAVWQFGGDGATFPLQPGEDAVVSLGAAIDHSAQYPLSVNLNKPGYFVCYNPTYFTNTSYHPAPGNNIDEGHILNVIVKTGQANAYTFSVNSPATIIFRAPEGMTMAEYVATEGAIVQMPGSSVDKVVVVQPEWVLDAVEVFNGGSSSNAKRIPSALDAGFVTLSGTFLNHTLHRQVNEDLTGGFGYEVLWDTNNSSSDFYEREIQSLHD